MTRHLFCAIDELFRPAKDDLFLLQAALPLWSFLRLMVSSRDMLYFLFRRKSLSMARKRCRVIYRLSVGPPWVIPMKSSRYTLTWARAVARTCGDRASHSLLAASVALTSCTVVFGGFVSARCSRWWGGTVWRMERVSSAWSLTVSGDCAEEGGGFYVPHGYREVESDEVLLIGCSFWH